LGSESISETFPVFPFCFGLSLRDSARFLFIHVISQQRTAQIVINRKECKWAEIRGQARIACPPVAAGLVVTCSTPITVEVAHIRATIKTIKSYVAIVLADVTRVTPNVPPVGAQFCS
jgi:hypothetical protein